MSGNVAACFVYLNASRRSRFWLWIFTFQGHLLHVSSYTWCLTFHHLDHDSPIASSPSLSQSYPVKGTVKLDFTQETGCNS